jgi:hypothetical protein
MNISDFYKPVDIENLIEIQQEVLKLIPENLLDKTTLTYIENNKEIFLKIPVLIDFLKSKKMNWSVGSIAVNITQGYDAGNFHMDSGPYKHSLNIPIIGCENTWINFFKVNADYKVVNVENQGKTHHFFRYTEDQCELIYEAETSNPYLLGVKTPHRVINKSNQTRIMLLIRLFPGPWQTNI